MHSTSKTRSGLRALIPLLALRIPLFAFLFLFGTLAWAVLSPPANLAATGGNGQVTLSWSAVGGATGYNVYRSTFNASDLAYFSKITATPVTTSSYLDTGLTNGTTYYYKLSTLDSSGESGVGNSVVAVPVAPAAVPTGLSASASSDTQINLSWTAVSGATSYRVEQSPDGTTWTLVSTPSDTSASALGLIPFTSYSFRVRASNAQGDSAWSSSVSATTRLQSPTLSGTSGDGQVVLSWKAIANATNYSVLRLVPGDTVYRTIGGNSSTTYTDTGLTNGWPTVIKSQLPVLRLTAKVLPLTPSPSLPSRAHPCLRPPRAFQRRRATRR